MPGEQARKFVDVARKYLRRRISIGDKREETDLLHEYMVMEHEKLKDGLGAFTEDRDHYEAYKIGLQQKSHQAEAELRANTREQEEMLA